MSENHQENFEEQGLVFLKGFQTTEQVADINGNLERVIRDVVPNLPPEQVFYEDKEDTSTLKQIQLLQDHDAYFSKLMTDGPFRKLAELLLDSEVVCKNMQFFNKPPLTGQATPPHQDGYFFKLDPCEAITMWLALEPVDEENGCVRYVPQSQKRGIRPHGKTGTLGFSQGITDFPNEHDRATEIPFPAQPGDLLAHHALTIHRAGQNNSRIRTRRALGLIYYSVNAKQDLRAWNEYQKTLVDDLTKTGKI